MSGHQYISNPNNLFEDDNDVDDETFLQNSRVNGTTSSSTNPFEGPAQAFEEKRQQIENRTLESSQRSLGLLYETEEVGKATAAELAKQREQLEKSSRQLEEINATLRFSQKHLNGLKSVFGGLKNYLSGNRDNMSPRMAASPSGSNISDKSVVESPPLSPDDRYDSHPVSRLREDTAPQKVQTNEKAGSFDQKLEQNLDEMCGGLGRLKDLALDLQGEIESQNDLLDNMNYKMEDVDIKINKQQKDMDKLLGKK